MSVHESFSSTAAGVILGGLIAVLVALAGGLASGLAQSRLAKKDRKARREEAAADFQRSTLDDLGACMEELNVAWESFRLEASPRQSVNLEILRLSTHFARMVELVSAPEVRQCASTWANHIDAFSQAEPGDSGGPTRQSIRAEWTAAHRLIAETRRALYR